MTFHPVYVSEGGEVRPTGVRGKSDTGYRTVTDRKIELSHPPYTPDGPYWYSLQGVGVTRAHLETILKWVVEFEESERAVE